jgi:hypothetical protein
MLWSATHVFDCEYETPHPEVPVTATPPVPTATSWTPDQWEGWREVVRRLATITTAGAA